MTYPNKRIEWECQKPETDLPILHITFGVQQGSPGEQCRKRSEFQSLKKNQILATLLW